MNLKMQLLEKNQTREIYRGIKRSLTRKKGFGLFFIICNPSQAQDITKQIKEDFGKFKSIETLILKEEVAQLHEKIATIKKQKSVDILLISGIEKSLNPYVKSGIEADQTFGGRGGYYQLDLISLPPLLSHLNLQRESYKKDFPFALVFFLSPFAYRFLVRRAPDFFDWRSGIFEVPKDPKEVELEASRILAESDYNEYLTWTTITRQNEIRKIKNLINQPYLNDETKVELYGKIGLLTIAEKDYKETIQVYDPIIKTESNYSIAWNNRGIALRNLGRYEEAIQSFDQAINLKPSYSIAWNNKGNALGNLGRYEEAIQSYDQAIKIQPNFADAWYNRAWALENLGRYEEAIQSFNQAIKIDRNHPEANSNKEIMNEKQIKNRNYTLIIDKSHSMGRKVSKEDDTKTRWEAIQEAVTKLSKELEKKKYDPDGLTIYTFATNFERFDKMTSKKIEEIFATEKPEPFGCTNTAEVLEDALKNYFERKNNNKNGNKTGETIFIITDGEATDEEKLTEVIISVGQKVKQRDELVISFLQIGDDEEATSFLKKLDDNLRSYENKNYMDIVDTKTFNEIQEKNLEITDILINALYD